MSSFEHPLARDAKIWPSAGLGGQTLPILVIITTLELNPQHPRFKPKNFERLTAAATAWVEENRSQASDFLLMNRPKKWAGDKD